MRHLIILFVFNLFVSPIWLFAESSVEGRIVFKGSVPVSETIKIRSELPTCGKEKKISRLILDKGNGVQNAVVTLVGVPIGTPPVSKEGFLDQVKCEFLPHVQVFPVGSILKVTSSDPIIHNVHGFNEDGTTAFNINFPVVGSEIMTKIKRAGVIHVRCDSGHTWMNAYIVAINHPYYALTDSNGHFKIDGIPPGNYEIEVWHEWLGKHREPITVQAEPSVIDVTLTK
ncbi:MAG TPA: carboxypeptidase regulatory-like domain-containing protein [Candidatus Omnitrophota bacterium]|nr:carboxypeptidase regulatory-like domain-containing protein [Candidatus Omnitrophota bacterium]